MADSFDDLLRAADRGVPIGTTQRYFKSAAKPAPTPQPAATAPDPAPAALGESEKDVIDRVLGRKKQSMSDAPGELAAGQQYAAAQGTRVMLPGGQVAEFPPEMSHAQIEAVVRQHLGVKEPEKVETKKEPSFVDKIRAEWATTKKAEADLKSPVVAAIEKVTPSAATAASTVATAGGGALAAKVAPAALKAMAPATGRILTSTGIKALERVAKGQEPLGWNAIIDAALEVGTEGLTAGLGRALKSLGAAKRAFDYTSRAPTEGLEYVRDRLRKGRFIVPSIDPAKKITFDEAIQALHGKRGTDWLVTKKEIANIMNLADKQELGPHAGQIFQQMTKTRRGMGRADPSSLAVTAEGTRGALKSNVVRAAEDEAATSRDKYGVPTGVYAWEALKAGGGKVIEKVGGPFLRAATHMIP